MGAYQNNADTPSKAKKKRGSVNNAGRLEIFAKGQSKGSADWGGCDATRVHAVVTAITHLGGAVLFGLSKDEGAHTLTLMLDDGRQTLYFNGSADLDEELDMVLATLDTLAT